MEWREESLEEIMNDFRRNGRNVDYVEVDIDEAELARSAPDAKSLIVGILQGSTLDPEMKIIRPPSRTPHYLPTSAFNVMANLPTGGVPAAYSLYNPNFVHQVPYQQDLPSCIEDLTEALLQMNLSDRGDNSFFTSTTQAIPNTQQISTNQLISRQTFGSGSTMQPGFAELRESEFWKWDCCASNTADPVRSQLPVTMNPGTPVETPVETPVVAVVKQSCSDNEGSSEEDLSIRAESEDSGNFTSGELSPNPIPSPTSTSGAESDAPSDATVVNDDASEPIQNSCVLLESPKSYPPGGYIPLPWLNKKHRRVSGSRSDDGNRYKECVFCKTNGESPMLYRSHVLKDKQGRVMCRVLQRYVCPLCGATGVYAHTLKYCPRNKDPPEKSVMTTLKSMRSATGNMRMITNSRRAGTAEKRVFKKINPSTAA